MMIVLGRLAFLCRRALSAERAKVKLSTSPRPSDFIHGVEAPPNGSIHHSSRRSGIVFCFCLSLAST